MTTEEVAALFQNAVMSGYVLPGLIFILCGFGGVVVSLGCRRKRTTAVVLGGFFTVAGLYLGNDYTAVPLAFFALMVLCGFLGGSLSGLKRTLVRIRRTSRVRRLE